MAIITISRGIKSRGAELAKRLSERLEYACKNREVVLEGAKKYNIMAEDLFRQLEKSPGLWQKLTREHERNQIFLQCSLIDAVKQNNIIYHGFAGQLFLRGIRHVLKVHLYAPLEERVRAVMEESGKNYDEASYYVAKIDEQRMLWVKYVCGENWRDPSLYDISFSTENMTIDTICEIIALTVGRPEFRTSAEAARGLEDLSLVCEVKAALASDDKMWNIPITVAANNGVVTLRGTVKDSKVRDAFVAIASQVKGVAACQVNISLTTDRLSKGTFGHD
ncbi:MAG: cytidylate kinase family protein [Candidatus Zixiibacteriota bacterium]